MGKPPLIAGGGRWRSGTERRRARRSVGLHGGETHSEAQRYFAAVWDLHLGMPRPSDLQLVQRSGEAAKSRSPSSETFKTSSSSDDAFQCINTDPVVIDGQLVRH